jgi:hypothetical protein
MWNEATHLWSYFHNVYVGVTSSIYCETILLKYCFILKFLGVKSRTFPFLHARRRFFITTWFMHYCILSIAGSWSSNNMLLPLSQNSCNSRSGHQNQVACEITKIPLQISAMMSLPAGLGWFFFVSFSSADARNHLAAPWTSVRSGHHVEIATVTTRLPQIFFLTIHYPCISGSHI